MQRDIAAGDFIEHAEFSGNLYGTRWATQAEWGLSRGSGFPRPSFLARPLARLVGSEDFVDLGSTSLKTAKQPLPHQPTTSGVFGECWPNSAPTFPSPTPPSFPSRVCVGWASSHLGLGSSHLADRWTCVLETGMPRQASEQAV